MANAKSGDTVKVAYTGMLRDGTIFDKSSPESPLEFTIGGGQMIEDFETAITGMAVGDTKKVDIPAERAYGERSEERVIEVTRSRFPDNLDPKVGQRIEVQDKDGDPLMVTISDISKNTVTLDANHPLAGRDLTFELSLVAIG